MHASNLYKTVLKGRAVGVPSDTHAASRSRSPSPETTPQASKPRQRVSCACSPTTHPGSFRCRYHRKGQNTWGGRPLPGASAEPAAVTAVPALSEKTKKVQQRSSRLRDMVTAAAVAEGTSTEEASDEGPWRFLKFAVGAGAVAAAVGAGAAALKHHREGSTEDILSRLGPDAPPALAAGGLGEGGSQVYEVRGGDTLSGIAHKLGTSAEVIQVSNELSSDTIQPGQKLWIPKTHTIQKGDTLAKIAREHNTSIDSILKINSVAKPDLIFPGDILLLP